MSLHTATFTVTMPHPEGEDYEEEFECTFECSEGEAQTWEEPGCPPECNLVEAYTTVSGPVNRVDDIPQAEKDRIEIEMMSGLEEAYADDCDPPETDRDYYED